MGEPLPTAPTIGLNVKQFKKGGVKMKVWDIGGQVQYRSEWGTYTKGCDCIIYLVDAGNVFNLSWKSLSTNLILHKPDCLSISKKELHLLLEDTELNGIPILVIGNKIDIKPHLTESEIITGNLVVSSLATLNYLR